MNIAVDKCGNRVCADDAVKGEQYFCPICHEKVILRAGEVNIHHFAHVSGHFCDGWDYDMSEWHHKMQDCFPKENQEIIIEHNGEKHRADVCVGDIIIEFQHSEISAAEFNDRNRFYMDAGYRLVWIFDFRNSFNYDQIEIEEGDNGEYFRWKNPKRIFKLAPSISDYSKDFTVWISGCSAYDDYYIEKVIWTAKDEVGDISFSRFILSEDYGIDLGKITDASCLFYSKNDWFNVALDKFKQNYNSDFSIKIKGVKGYSQSSYTCPRTGIFGVMSQNNRCKYCKYCQYISHKKRKDENIYNVYCCYPNIVRTQPGAGGRECCCCEIYEI